MKIIDKIKARSSRKNRVKGQIKTLLATTSTVLLTMGIVTNPIGIAGLTIVALVTGGQAVNHALKVGK
jgi:hypothetical protein